MELSPSWEGTRTQLMKKFSVLFEADSSLPCSQEPATCPEPEPDESNPRPHPIYGRYTLLLSSLLRLVIPSGLVSRGFLTKILFAPLLSPILDTFPTISSFLIRIVEVTETLIQSNY
jgi:hypothetical protein